ncbi:MAG: hypothetical protein JOZ40_23030, partial [Methylobacteriaceae bacterium]|nr:hypothetical protein [Methylobacteriaceae bacterium]
MRLTGYSDRWSVRPGEDIAFHVHCTEDCYTAQLVRLRHGDQNPKGPGFKEAEVASPLDGRHRGFAREICKGSYGIAELGDLFDGVESFSLSVWIWPTLPRAGAQGVLSWLAPPGDSGLGMFLAEAGTIECRLPGGRSLRSGVRLEAREWYHLALSIDGRSGAVSLSVVAKRWSPALAKQETVRTTLDGRADLRPRASLLFGAGGLEPTADGPRPVMVFNGKIARPMILAGVRLAADDPPHDAVLAAWDFGRSVEATTLVDVSGGGRHGRLVNRPARAMTGPDWPGGAPRGAPTASTHDAVHFHDDDVADVGWPESHRLRVPDDLPSGVYALRLRTGGEEDHLPFFVCPPRGARDRPPLAVLMPTLSYLAYANESLDLSGTVQLSPMQDMSLRAEAYRYVAENGLKSTYDTHSDGSGICH